MLDVVTVFAPRPKYPNWRDFLPLLELQRRTAAKFKHRHVVVTDRDMEIPGQMIVELPESLMHLQLEGQLAYLRQWDGAAPFVFVDADCLIQRDLTQAFDGRFDIGLTWRANPVAPINNGAMYIAAGAKAAALKFYGRALELCGEHWGGDQEAIGKAAGPVPSRDCVKRRGAARIAFLSMRTHNVTPMKEGAFHGAKPGPFVVHFKGDRKHWMKTYAERFLLLRR